MSTELSLLAAFTLGLLGSTHCLGMCGGISAALSAGNTPGHLPRLLCYNGGRVLTYASLGALLGLFGGSIAAFAPALGPALRTLAGLLLIAMGLYLTQWWLGLTRLEQAGALLWRRLQPLTGRLLPADSLPRALGLGLLWGLLPCGLVYSTLSWALAAADWRYSAALMLCFGLGTLPAMLASGLAAQRLLSVLRQRGARTAAGLLIIALGAYTAVSPWWHAGPAGHRTPAPAMDHSHHTGH